MAPHSRVKNVFGEQWKEKYQDLRMSSRSTEGQPIAASTGLIAVLWEVGGGGAVGVIRTNTLSIRKPAVAMFRGHKAAIQDVEFSPFYDTIFATASDDSTIKVWEVGPEGSNSVKQDSIATLSGHDKKVNFCTFNPVADWILASGSLDTTVKVWNLEAETFEFSARHPQSVNHLRWNSNGSLLASTCKDKNLRILDIRAQATSCEVLCHDGAKAAKVEWLGGMVAPENLLVTAGFSKGAGRECALWDLRKLTDPLERHDIDRGAGTITPVWDEGTGLIYLPGKGDGNIRFCEVAEQSLHFLTEFRSNVPCKAVCFAPKRSMDVMKCEVARALRTEGSGVIQPISFVVPRRATEFQADLFPDCFAGEPSLSAAEWLKGGNAEPVRGSMLPGEDGKLQFVNRQPHSILTDGTSRAVESPVLHTPAVLKKQLSRADTKIAELNEEAKERGMTAKMLAEQNDKLKEELDEKDIALESKEKEIGNLESEISKLRKAVDELEGLFGFCQDTMHHAAWQEAQNGKN